MPNTVRNLNLGSGTDIRRSSETEIWVNLDSAALEGVDLVCDLTKFPWDIAENSFDRIIAYDILEHLPDTVRTMEELWRILNPGGVVEFRIPYWNSVNQITDPTHIRWFNENSLQFWDIDSRFFKARSYYTTARYRRRSLIIDAGLWRWQMNIGQGLIQKIVLKISNKIGNVTRNMYIQMEAVKEEAPPPL